MNARFFPPGGITHYQRTSDVFVFFSYVFELKSNVVYILLARTRPCSTRQNTRLPRGWPRFESREPNFHFATRFTTVEMNSLRLCCPSLEPFGVKSMHKSIPSTLHRVCVSPKFDPAFTLPLASATPIFLNCFSKSLTHYTLSCFSKFIPRRTSFGTNNERGIIGNN